MEKFDKHLYLGVNRCVTSHVALQTLLIPQRNSLSSELATEVPFTRGVLLFIRTLGHLPAHIYVVISPIAPPFVDPSGPSCPQR